MPLGNHLSTSGQPAPYPNEKQGGMPPTFENAAPEAPPPTYTATANPQGPSLDEINASFSNLRIGDTPKNFPDIDLCLAHLKLLEAFFILKQEVGYTDGAFDIWDSRAPGTYESVANDQAAMNSRLEALSKIREKRWALYVTRAVHRFEIWWIKVLCQYEQSVMLTEGAMRYKEFQDFPSAGKVQRWTTSMLPPLDVLMVWHSFMLNPRSYLEDCIRFGLKNLWTTGLPWQAINAATTAQFNYEVPQAAKDSWVQITGRAWDNLEDAKEEKVKCPRCSNIVVIPWTTCGMPEVPTSTWRPGLVGNGYGEKDLSYYCERCGGEITHDLLRVGKFRKDTENLLLNNWPMGGTILHGTRAVPIAIPAKDVATFSGTFPNRLIVLELRTQILEALTPTTSKSMADIRSLIESAIKNDSIVRKVNSKPATGMGGKLNPGERLSIRKMMSRYWDNHTPFAMDLSGAVIRQGSFINKMHGLDWLHSPASGATMNRLLVKYDRFFRIMATNPGQTAVPTLDVDLAWHTHQLSPRAYYSYSISNTAGDRFINHDDKIDEDKLSDGFEWTSKQYEKNFGEVYSECTCWYCEAIRAKHVSTMSKVFGSSKHDKITDGFYNSGAAKMCPPDNSAHISNHNSVPSSESATSMRVSQSFRKVRENQLEEAYQKACKRAQKKGRSVPVRERYVQDYWGYQYPYYYPYMGSYMFMTPGLYYYPMILPVGVGYYGACVAGTCGGAAAAGGCGSCGGGGGCGGGCSSGAAGCGGASGGGCGGGGGGGCGGGGGGCGGGGGGCGGGGG